MPIAAAAIAAGAMLIGNAMQQQQQAEENRRRALIEGFGAEQTAAQRSGQGQQDALSGLMNNYRSALLSQPMLHS